MRTVHEIETGRPADVGGRAQAAPEHKAKRRRSPSYPENGEAEDDLDRSDEDHDPSLYSSAQRYRYLKRKLRWADERNRALRNALQDAETRRWRNWVAKEALLDRVFEKASIGLS